MYIDNKNGIKYISGNRTKQFYFIISQHMATSNDWILMKKKWLPAVIKSSHYNIHMYIYIYAWNSHCDVTALNFGQTYRTDAAIDLINLWEIIRPIFRWILLSHLKLARISLEAHLEELELFVSFLVELESVRVGLMYVLRIFLKSLKGLFSE